MEFFGVTNMKVKGLPYNILEEALEQSKEGRLHILDEMLKIECCYFIFFSELEK